MANILIVERESQVRDLIDRDVSDARYWIAVGPSAMWALEQRGIAYQIPEDFYDVQELENLCLGTHERVEWLCRRLDDSLFSQSPELKEWGIRPFLFHIFPLIILFDGVVSRIFQLRAILRAYPDSRILTHTAKPRPWGLFETAFSYDEALWGQLLSIPGWDCDIELLDGPRDTSSLHYRGKFNGNLSLPKKWVRQKVEGFVVRRFALRSMVSNFGVSGWKGLRDSMGRKTNGALLFNNGTYEWDGVIPLLEDRGWRVFFTDDRFFRRVPVGDGPRKAVESEPPILKEPDVLACFQYRGIFFYPLLQDRFGWILRTAARNSKHIMAQVSYLVRKYNIKAVLTSTDATFTSHAVAQAARYLGLPVICWQHGGVIGRNNNIELNEYNDLMTSTHFLAYGEGVSATYQPFVGKFPGKIISIGSARFDSIREKEKRVSVKTDAPRTKRILYATNPYYGGMWYGGLSPPFNDRLLYREQSVIVKYLRTLADKYGGEFSVTIKLHPSPFPEDPLWVTELLAQPEIRVVKQSLTFIQLLERNDIIILDSPATTVLQAAATEKPLFVLMSVVVYPEQAKDMLERRAVCADEAGDLMLKLDQYLRTGIYDADVMDNEFLKAYGIYLDDGLSAERAVAEVLKIVDGI